MASLGAISRAEFEEAKRKYGFCRRVHYGTLALGVLALLLPSPSCTYALGIITLLLTAAAWLLRCQARAHQGLGEEARRRAMLTDALGLSQEPLDVADLKQRVGHEGERRAERWEDPNYFASRQPVGQDRLYDHLQECAFWSKHLYRTAARRAFQTVAVFVVIIALAALIALLIDLPHETTLVVARTLVLALTFLPASDQLGWALAWRSSASQCETIDRRLEKLAKSSLESLLLTFADYSVAAAVSPPIPTKIYDGERNRLNRLWGERRVNLADGSG